MRQRGLGWNVHRGQLLCIKIRSSQTRKPHAARCPAAAARLAGLLKPEGRGEPPLGEGWQSAVRHECDAGREGKLPPHTHPPTTLSPPLHLEYCLLSRQWNVRNNTNINTNFSHCTSGPNAESDGHAAREPGRRFSKMRFPDVRRRHSEAAVELQIVGNAGLFFFSSSSFLVLTLTSKTARHRNKNNSGKISGC